MCSHTLIPFTGWKALQTAPQAPSFQYALRVTRGHLHKQMLLLVKSRHSGTWDLEEKSVVVFDT